MNTKAFSINEFEPIEDVARRVVSDETPAWAAESVEMDIQADGSFTVDHVRDIPSTDTNVAAYITRSDTFSADTCAITTGEIIVRWEPGNLTAELVHQAAATLKIVEDLIAPDSITAAK